MGEVVRRQLAVDGLDGGDHGRACRDAVVGLADVEGDRGTLALDEQPGRRAEDLRHAPGEDLGGFERVVVAGTERRDEAGRITAARERPRLEAVIAEVGQAADADPRRDIQRGPAGQDGDGEPLRVSGRHARQSSEGPARQGHDGGRARIARALGQRAVEVGHDEQRAGR